MGSDAYDYIKTHGTKIYTTPSMWFYVGVLLVQGVVYMTLTIILDNIKFRLNDKEHLGVDEMKS